MKVRSGRTLESLEASGHKGDELGQMAMTICVEESKGKFRICLTPDVVLKCHQSLPTRLSTKLSFRSACLTSGGGQPVRVVAVLEVRLGLSRSERDTAGRLKGLHDSCVQDAFAPSGSW